VTDKPEPRPPRRILVIEDSQSQALRLSLLLQNNGYEPIVAANGVQGLEMLNRGGISIAITDWLMPEMDGPAFCRAVRVRELKNYIYIILVTAKGEAESVVAGLEAGADDFMFKPIDAAVLLARLSTADRILDLERSLIERNREIEKLAVTDALTGLYNRRYLVDRLEEERRRCARYGHVLSVVMGDVDHFKAVNDEFGHHAGDEVLRAVAAALVRGTRQGVDWVARFGGEEFVVVMPETDPVGALIAAERLRRSVAAAIVDADGTPVSVTISFGVASLEPGSAAAEGSTNGMLQLADTRMYEAKSRGRNRTVAE
jgi:two-component system, cell cycle response regulator